MATWSTFYSRVFALAVAALLGYALFKIFTPFFNSLAWAVFLAFLLYPLNLRLRRRLHGSARAAGLLTLLTPIVILLPLAAVSVEFVAQVSALVRMLQKRAQELDIRSFSDLQQFPWIARANGWLQARAGISRGPGPVLDRFSESQDLLQRAAGISGSVRARGRRIGGGVFHHAVPAVFLSARRRCDDRSRPRPHPAR